MKVKAIKILSLALAIVMIASLLVGCGSKQDQGPTTAPEAEGTQATPVANTDDTLVMAYTEDIGILNPHNYDGKMWAQDWVYDGLTAFVDNEVVPCLAESWDISEDGKIYTFHLRQGVKFTDGTDFNAEIAKKNMDVVLLHAERHSWLEYMNQVQEVNVLDDYTLEIKLANAYYPFLQELSLDRPMTFCAEATFTDSGDTGADGIKEPIGTGMWKLAEHKEGEYAVFERNEDYWGEKPKFKYIRVEVIPDVTTVVSALKTGEIDMIYDVGTCLTADSFNELKRSNFKTYVSDPTASLSLALNTNKGATGELAVRQALEYAVDRQTICDSVYDGLRTPLDYLFPNYLPYCDVEYNTSYDYDFDKAVALLDEAGWILADGAQYRAKNGESLSLEYCYISTDSISKTLGEVLQQMYGKLGVEIKLVGEESNSFYDRQKNGDFDIIVSETWGTHFDPHSMVASFREPSHADYRAQEGIPEKAELDALITDMLVETDEQSRQDMYTKIFNILQDEAVYIPVCGKTLLCVTADDIDGMKFESADAHIYTQGLFRVS